MHSPLKCVWLFQSTKKNDKKWLNFSTFVLYSFWFDNFASFLLDWRAQTGHIVHIFGSCWEFPWIIDSVVCIGGSKNVGRRKWRYTTIRAISCAQCAQRQGKRTSHSILMPTRMHSMHILNILFHKAHWMQKSSFKEHSKCLKSFQHQTIRQIDVHSSTDCGHI